MFPCAYCQVIRGEFIQLKYTRSTVNVDIVVTEHSKRVEEQDDSTSYSHILYTPGWCVDCSHGVNVRHLYVRIDSLRERYPVVPNITFTHWTTQRDPWHMFSSFFQYLCLAPSFINVLNVYAFCNLHDVSWGTKGSDKAEALPSVSSKKGKSEEAAVVQDTERMQEDLDAVFKETVNRAVTKLDVKEVPEKPSMDDQNRTFRTRLVVFWMLSNAGLAVAIENINGLPSSNALADEDELRKKQNMYFAFILYSTFGLAAVRFTGVSGSRSPSFANLTLLHSVLVVLVQAQSLCLFQTVVKFLVGAHLLYRL